MDKVRTIVLYGSSLSVAAIGAGLTEWSDWQLVPLDSSAPATVARLRELHPDVLIFDLAAAQLEAAIPLLTEFPALLLIGIDLEKHGALVLHGERPELFTTDDIVRVISRGHCGADAETHPPIR